MSADVLLDEIALALKLMVLFDRDYKQSNPPFNRKLPQLFEQALNEKELSKNDKKGRRLSSIC